MKIYVMKFGDFINKVQDRGIEEVHFALEYPTQEVSRPAPEEGAEPVLDVLVKGFFKMCATWEGGHETNYIFYAEKAGQALISDEAKLQELYKTAQKLQKDKINEFKAECPQVKLVEALVTQ